ncbi:aldo/keto reductase [uncultured Methanobrevibacter sp.]|uniref:aldo/keto reductase n=1 Tax=uncultured Methanobrevibacter sp. TaxID=253161 RepID=UPI0026DFDEC0|nr:aldo/keto reductase [uncultured Methanobrevibacter sp.]
MLINKFKGSDYKISKLGLGTVQFGLDYGFTKKKTQDEVNSILETAVDNDVTLIDTAREYGDSESKIGNFISEFDNDFVIATKLRLIDNLNDLDFNTLENSIYSSVNESLDSLSLDKIPILQLHQTDEILFKNADFWEVIAQLKEDNLIDLFGVSVYGLEETQFILNNFTDSVDFFQIPYNIFDRRFEDMYDILSDNSVGLISRSTFLKGIIPCSLEDVPKELDGIKYFKKELEELANSLDLRVDELANLFVYSNDFINSTIFGVNSSEELEKNIMTLDKYNDELFENVDFDKLRIYDVNLIDPRLWADF